MKILDERVLRVGDIILTSEKKPTSFAIRKVTKGHASHALIYVAHCSAIDAMPEGVHARNTQRMLFEDDIEISVLRPKVDLTPTETTQLCEYARSLIGTQYSKAEALQVVVGKRKPPSRKQFCSRLVAKAYASIGRHIVEDVSYCSPADIARSSDLAVVIGATITATPEHIAWAMSGDAVQVMRDTTNRLLGRLREKSEKIQELNDIHGHLLANPADDTYFSEALKELGYLETWRAAYEPFQWRYHTKLIDRQPLGNSVAITKYAIETVKSSSKEYRYAVNLAAYTAIASQNNLLTFRLFRDLYSHLADLNRRRQVVARYWLAKYEPQWMADWDRKHHLQPHSSEWFAVMEQHAQPVAAEARAKIARAGTEEACSVCGSVPSTSTVFPGTFIAPEIEATLRLCPACIDASDALRAS